MLPSPFFAPVLLQQVVNQAVNVDTDPTGKIGKLLHCIAATEVEQKNTECLYYIGMQISEVRIGIGQMQQTPSHSATAQ